MSFGVFIRICITRGRIIEESIFNNIMFWAASAWVTWWLQVIWICAVPSAGQMSTELAQINLCRHLHSFPSIKVFRDWAFTKCVVLVWNFLVADILLPKWFFFCPAHPPKNMPVIFLKNNEQRTLSLSAGNWIQHLAFKVLIFLGKNASYYSLSWPHRGNIWNRQKGAFLLFQTNEK